MTMDSNSSNWSAADRTSEKLTQQSANVHRDLDLADFNREWTTQGSTASSILPQLEVSASTDAQSLASIYKSAQGTAVSDIYEAARNDTVGQFSSFLPAFAHDSAPALRSIDATSNMLQGIGDLAASETTQSGVSGHPSSFNWPGDYSNPAARADAAQLNKVASTFQNQALSDIQGAAANLTDDQFSNFLQSLSSDYATDLNANTATPVTVPPEQPSPPVTVPPEQPSAPVTVPPEQPSSPVTVPPEQPSAPVTVPPEQPSSPVTVPPEQPSSPVTVPPEQPSSPEPAPPGTSTGSPGQGLYIDGKSTGMQPEINLSNATDLGKLQNIAGVNTSTGWNPSTDGVVGAVASKDNGTFTVNVANPWNENGHQGSYTEQIPIPDEGLAALEQQAAKTNSDGHVIIEDTANNTYYDFWLAQNIAPNGDANGQTGTARTLVQGALNGDGTPGSTAVGITEALSDTSVASGTHMLLFGSPTNWMSPGNPGLVSGSSNSDVTSAGGGLKEGDVMQLPEAVANAWIAANPNATAAQLQIIKDMEPTSVGGGGGMIVADQDGTGWSGDENAGIWQMGTGTDMTFLNNSNGPNILSNLEVYQ